MPPQALIALVAAYAFANYFPLDVLVRDLQELRRNEETMDQEVGGSNPFTPSIFLEICHNTAIGHS
jgi:hypothetical protein